MALIAATENNNFCLVEKLIYEGININERDDHDKTSLIIAAHNGYFDIVKLLTDNNADINLDDVYEWTAITSATDQGYFEIVRFLADRGANLNLQQYHEEGVESILVLLTSFLGRIRDQVDFGFTDENEYATLHRLIELYGYSNEEILHDEVKKDEFLAIIKEEVFETIKFLVSRGANVNNRDVYGQNILNYIIDLDIY